jgi:P-type Cu+ transporter
MASETHMVELMVPDLCCVECSQGVVSALRQAPGIRELQVLGMSEKVRITYDATIQPEKLVQAVEQAGYAVTSWRPEGQRVSNVAPSPPSESQTRRVQAFALLRLLFVGFVSLIALVEIAGESLGLLRGAEELVPWPLTMAVVVIGGYPIFRGAFFGLRQRRINTDAVMSVGILAAAAIGEFIGAALIVFFVMVAHYLEDKTTERARRAIAELAVLQPKTARVKREAGEEEVAVTSLAPGEVVLVREGEQVPIDGRVVVGHAIVNQAPITGESLPVEKNPGDEVFAATVSERGYLEVEVQRVGEATTLGRIIHLVEEAEAQKSPVQRFADRFSAAFLPLVLTFSALTLLFSHPLVAAIAVLVAACPCAVGLATPLSVVAAVGAGARRGLLIKCGLGLETLAKVDTLVVDKTGTLTSGRPEVTEVVPLAEIDQDEILALAAALEQRASHPLASAVLLEAERRGLVTLALEAIEVLPSRGIVGHLAGQVWTFGSRRLLFEQGITFSEDQEQRMALLEQEGKTVLTLARSGCVVGVLAVADPIRAEVASALAEVRHLGIRRIVLLTGDNERVATAIARAASITEVEANLLPEDKIATVKRLQAEGRCVLMVGDGINDAPALTVG